MKTFKVGFAGGAVLLVAAGFGFGIAQAAGNHSERPVLSFADMEALEQGGSSGSYAESRPVLGFDDEEAYRLAKSPAEGMRLQNPIETGSVPSWSDAESSIIEGGGLKYRVGIDTGP